MPTGLEDIERTIASIEADIVKATSEGDDDDPDLREKLQGRLIQAQRVRGQRLIELRKHELRLVDSPEWHELSAKISRMVAGCDRCRVAVLKLLESDD